jgi:hypothetical protein
VSKYFEVLDRLERGKPGKPTSRLVDALHRPDPTERPKPSAGPHLALGGTRRLDTAAALEAVIEADVEVPIPEPSIVPSPRWQPALKGIDVVFNNIEALTMGRRPMSLVFAGAAATDAVQAVVMGLADHGERRGQRVVVADLCDSGGGRMLIPRHPSDVVHPSSNGDQLALRVDPQDDGTRDMLSSWRDQPSVRADILLIIAPPLVDSIDASLLASRCDGLVMVAVHDETHRASLATAGERARLTKTPTLGVVVSGRGQETPPWLRWILHQVTRTLGRP